MLKIEEQKTLLENCLRLGLDINFKHISLCNMINYRFSELQPNRGYQVHTEKWSRFYSNRGQAIEKFLELKNAKTKRSN